MRTLRSVSPSRRGIPTAGRGKGGPRSCTDDRGQTVSRPRTPRRTGAFTAPWSDEPRFSSAGAAPLVEPPARAIEHAKKVT
ncbi:hypothetical protein ACFXO2_28560 [Streptomyces sp. NPDC059152]|uniref:hypothetical protein n=1 Tax=unclassified Streptomyces TaxID=2593676 RepID=UPI0036A2F8BD